MGPARPRLTCAFHTIVLGTSSAALALQHPCPYADAGPFLQLFDGSPARRRKKDDRRAMLEPAHFIAFGKAHPAAPTAFTGCAN